MSYVKWKVSSYDLERTIRKVINFLLKIYLCETFQIKDERLFSSSDLLNP